MRLTAHHPSEPLRDAYDRHVPHPGPRGPRPGELAAVVAVDGERAVATSGTAERPEHLTPSAALTRFPKEPPVGPDLINGIPAHVLLVHVVVILVPLTALCLIVCAFWPSVMRRFGPVLPALALVALISVPLTTHAGEWLERHVDSNALVRRHTELGDQLLPWATALFAASLALWWAYSRAHGASPASDGGTARPAVRLPLRVIASALCLAVSIGATVQVYRIGDSGAKAAWHDGYSATARPDHG
ncbi:DUF2231 domain-containing protein [Streptomyces sp. cg36]|uniref:DUF2231 domain-containing protein n=1 Tax=Streptomyces sp. cg36 TaxID=3238798 RepID=UPI0034E24D8E